MSSSEVFALHVRPCLGPFRRYRFLTALQICSPDSFCSCTTLRAVYVPHFYRVRFLFSSSFSSWCAKPGSGSHREKDRKKQIPATLPTVSQTCSLESCCSPMTLRAVNVPYVCSLRFCFFLFFSVLARDARLGVPSGKGCKERSRFPRRFRRCRRLVILIHEALA